MDPWTFSSFKKLTHVRVVKNFKQNFQILVNLTTLGSMFLLIVLSFSTPCVSPADWTRSWSFSTVKYCVFFHSVSWKLPAHFGWQTSRCLAFPFTSHNTYLSFRDENREQSFLLVIRTNCSVAWRNMSRWVAPHWGILAKCTTRNRFLGLTIIFLPNTVLLCWTML